MMHHEGLRKTKKILYFIGAAQAVTVIFLLTLASFVAASFYYWQVHPHLGYDIDFDNGRVIQTLGTIDHAGALSQNDVVLTVNGLPRELFEPTEMVAGSDQTLTVKNLQGGIRPVVLRAELLSPAAIWELMVIPLLGLFFALPAVLVLYIGKPSLVKGWFALTMFLLALALIFQPLARYERNWLVPPLVLILISVGAVSLVFHWHFLEIKLSKNLLWAICGVYLVFCVAYVVIYWLNPRAPFVTSMALPYTVILLSFLLHIGLFAFQYVSDQLYRGILRMLALTFIAGIGPTIYFGALPLLMGYPRNIPSLIIVAPMVVIPINYTLLVANKKRHTRKVSVVLSFILAMMMILLLIEMAAAFVGADLTPVDRLGRDLPVYLWVVGIAATGAALFHLVSNIVRGLIYGNTQSEAQQMQQLHVNLMRDGDANLVLMQTAQIFNKFYNFDYLRIILQDGTLIKFFMDGEGVVESADKLMAMSVLNRIALRTNMLIGQQTSNLFIDLPLVQDLAAEYPQVFGEEPTYVMPLQGRHSLLGLIVAGRRHKDELFDSGELQQLLALLMQYQVIVENLFLINEVERHSSQVRRLGQQMMEAREDERRRIARDMHDNIIQAITAFRYTFNDLYDRDKLAVSDEEADDLQRALQNISQDIRDICFNLRPPALDATGFRSAIVSLIDSYHRDHGLSIDLGMSDHHSLDNLSDMVSICLYRVLQEALLNITRHAQTKSAWVALDASNDWVEMRVEDNGCGFVVPGSLNDFVSGGHYGLTGIKEFVELANGVLQMSSSPGNGTRMRIRIPLRKGE